MHAFTALTAAAALAAVVAGFSGSGAHAPAIPAGGADAISSAEVAALWSSVAGLTLQPQSAQLDDPRNFARAVAGMRVPPAEAERLIRTARAEGRRIAILTLWDNMDEDGDIVDVRIGAQSWTVPLRTEPTALTVIYVPGETITLTGRVDGGGGGVTAGIGLNTGPLPLPPLAVGQARGHVGSDTYGTLTRALRGQPACVVLLDEIEKAHPEVHRRFLTAWNGGFVTEASDGAKVPTTDAIFILTTNAAASAIGDLANGTGVARDLPTAFRWMTKAAATGYAMGERNLAVAYEIGVGTPVDMGRAVEWFVHAAEHGNIDSFIRLGAIYRDGKSVPVDLPKATTWFRKAALKGSAEGQFQYALALEQGRGTTTDKVQAYVYFNLASVQGYAQAESGLGRLKSQLSAEERERATRMTEAMRTIKSTQ